MFKSLKIIKFTLKIVKYKELWESDLIVFVHFIFLHFEIA